jgi:hypothetical protein
MMAYGPTSTSVARLAVESIIAVGWIMLVLP